MKDDQLLEHLFQIIGKANRIRILKFIGAQQRSVSEIVEYLGVSQPLVSHHLKTLRKSEVLVTQRNGPFIYYSLKDTRLLDVLGFFLEIAYLTYGDRNNNPMFPCPSAWNKPVENNSNLKGKQ